jgi:putative ABC transport system substrate-binding protein
MPKRLLPYLIILCATLLVMASVRPGLAHEVLIVQSSAIGAYQEAVSGFDQAFGSTSMEGIASIQASQALILDPAAADSIHTVTRKYQDLQPNLIVAVGTAALEAVKDLPGPIIYLMVPNPEAVAGKRTNITGIRMATGPKQQLAAIKAAFPSAKKIGLLHNPATAGNFPSLARKAAEGLGLTLVDAPAANDREASILIPQMAGRIDALLLTPDPTLISEPLLSALTLVSLEKKIPLIAFAPKYLKQGAAMVVFTSPEQLGRQAADMAKRLLAAPAHGPVRPEYGQETTVLTNERIIKTLGIVADHPTTEGGTSP